MDAADPLRGGADHIRRGAYEATLLCHSCTTLHIVVKKLVRIGGATRLAYVGALADEKGHAAVGFLRRAVAITPPTPFKSKNCLI